MIILLIKEKLVFYQFIAANIVECPYKKSTFILSVSKLIRQKKTWNKKKIKS